jgi:GGDEF domain-containing protein
MQYDVILDESVFDGLMRDEAAARCAAAEALWQAEEEPQTLLSCWSVPDPEEEALLIAAAAMVRRRLGAPIAAAALAGSQSGVILLTGDQPRLAMSLDDPVLQLLRGLDIGCAILDAAKDPSMARSALCAPDVGARAMLVAPIRLPGGPAIGVLVAAARCKTGATERQREELIRIAERTAEEVLARYSARTDPATGALSVAGLTATLGREARRSAMHGRPAALAVLSLSRALGAPRPFDAAAVSSAEAFATTREPWLADHDRLPPQILRMVAEETLRALRESDAIASVPTPTPTLQMDAALDAPCVVQTAGPTCLALLMPETTAEQAMLCVRRIQAWLSSVELPGAPGRHVCATAGVTEISPDASGGKSAAHATLNRAYAAVERARSKRVSATLNPAPV